MVRVASAPSETVSRHQWRRLSGYAAPTRAEYALAAAVALAYTLGLVVHAARAGAWGASRNDDWVYVRLVRHFAETGELVVDPYVRAMSVGNIVPAGLLTDVFGSSLTVLQAWTACLGVVGLVAAYALFRGFAGPGQAALALGTLALGPIFGVVDISFMSDVPALAFGMLTLWAGVRGVTDAEPGRRQYRWLGGSALLAIVGFSVREYVIAAPLAVAAVMAVDALGRPRRTLHLVRAGAYLAVVGLSSLLLLKSRAALPGAAAPSPLAPVALWDGVAATVGTLFTLALLTCPALALLSGRRLWTLVRRRRTALAVTLVLVVTWVWLLADHRRVLLGNFLTQHNAYSETLPGEPPTVIPAPLWFLLQVLALVSAVGFALVVVASLPRASDDEPRLDASRTRARLTVLAYVLITLVGVLGVMAVSVPIVFDRYLLAVVAPVVVVTLTGRGWWRLRSRRSSRAYLLALGAYALVGLAIVDATATVDGARWRFGTALAGEYQVDKAVVDAGYEWYGTYQPYPILPPWTGRPGEGWYYGLLKDHSVCILVRHGDGSDPAAGVLKEYATRSHFGTPVTLVARTVSDHCPTPVTP